MSRAEKFVSNFEKAASVIAENAPKDLIYCVVVYARDRNKKTDDCPDGDNRYKVLRNTTLYDNYTIKERINTNL